MRSKNLIEYSIKMRVESIITVTKKSDYYTIISVISCFTAFFPFRKFEFRGTKDSKIQYKILLILFRIFFGGARKFLENA